MIHYVPKSYTASNGSLWNIEHNPKPTRSTALDWDYVAEDYEGPGDNRFGEAGSQDEAEVAIEALIFEHAPKRDQAVSDWDTINRAALRLMMGSAERLVSEGDDVS